MEVRGDEEKPSVDFCEEKVEVLTENMFAMAHIVVKKEEPNLEAEISSSVFPLNIKNEPEDQFELIDSSYIVSKKNLSEIKCENLIVKTSQCVINNTNEECVKFEFLHEEFNLPSVKGEIDNLEYVKLQPCSSKQYENVNIKKDVDIADIKPYEYELLNQECDLPSIKSEIDSPDYVYSQPCNSNQKIKPGKSVVKTVTKKKQRYECPVCTKNFQSVVKRNKHFNSHFDFPASIKRNKNYFKSSFGNCVVICYFCGTFFTNKNEYLLHSVNYEINSCSDRKTATEDVQKSFKCEICFEPFTSKTNLTIHSRCHTAVKPFKCEICFEPFTSKTNLTIHSRLHTAVKPFKCEICLKQFTSKTSLTFHSPCHTAVKPFTCEICLRQFTSKTSLTFHSRWHTAIKPFKCEICLEEFKLIGDLNLHLHNIHGREKLFQIGSYPSVFTSQSDKKPFKCILCAMQFKYKRSLTAHMRSHLAEKPFKCEICPRQFPDKAILTDHMRNHSARNSFKCEICAKHFKHERSLSVHIYRHADQEPFKCKICPRQFSHKRTLASHMKNHSAEHPFTCEICGQQFKYKRSLIAHIRRHAVEKPFKCDICPKQFSNKTTLTSHMRNHPETNPFICEVCLKPYTSKQSLIVHSRTHTGPKHV